MTDIQIAESTAISEPRCQTCKGATRIYGIEPHPRYANTDVHTYVCDVCDATQVIVVPLPKLKT
jgi:hypothetical protein